ncbi:MAG: tRNA (adenosine(37)-N6)-threonylcarbamoyltransferase complex dimerization subunit type 1 TsaB [Trueperaceae bacterium]
MSGSFASGLYLGLDTATPYLAVAVCSAQGSVLAATTELVERRHAARLISALEETLADAGVERTSLAAIACGIGPGSYTGLRVGVAGALGLARSLAVPLAGCDTLAAVAFGALEDDEEGLATLDARRGNLYVGRYRRQGQDIVTLASPRKVERQSLLEQHPGMRLIENRPPDPGFVARQAGGTAPFTPVYL